MLHLLPLTRRRSVPIILNICAHLPGPECVVDLSAMLTATSAYVPSQRLSQQVPPSLVPSSAPAKFPSLWSDNSFKNPIVPGIKTYELCLTKTLPFGLTLLFFC